MFIHILAETNINVTLHLHTEQTQNRKSSFRIHKLITITMISICLFINIECVKTY